MSSASSRASAVTAVRSVTVLPTVHSSQTSSARPRPMVRKAMFKTMKGGEAWDDKERDVDDMKKALLAYAKSYQDWCGQVGHRSSDCPLKPAAKCKARSVAPTKGEYT
ncbi:hypothetical protein LTR09_007362 [Extremus antarcticus]|uniref:CCHC-type domain-containing protein n=1 Tax=Extremus antarcticus TaxID=702011 RepID=A0AAJ0G6Y3_9PEZI|nr:hypothetical protein LTR09_007362 [Extremus antarcticus]